MKAVTTIALALVTLAACGGASKEVSNGQPEPETSRPVAVDEPEKAVEPDLLPLEVDVRVTRRFGQLVRLDIKGIGRSLVAKQPFEDPSRWNVTAMAADHMFTRAVNGPAQIIRDPVGRASGDLWDIEVSFWVAFNVPEDVLSMTVRVAAPGAAVYETELDLDWGASDGESVSDGDL